MSPSFKLLSLVAFMNPLLPHKDIYAEACKMALMLKEGSDGYLGGCMHNLEVRQYLNPLFNKGHSKRCGHNCTFRIYLRAFKHNGLCNLDERHLANLVKGLLQI